VISLARDLGASGVCLIFPAAAGAAAAMGEEALSEEERATVRSLQDLSFVFAEVPTARSMCAAAACSFLYVNPYGYVSPCTTVRYWMGNVRRTPLRELWERFARGMNIESPGNCLLNDPVAHRTLRDYLEALGRSHGWRP